MLKPIFPPKLKSGDHLRIIAPSRSLSMISQETQQIANERLEALGFKLSFGKHVHESDEFVSSSIDSRVTDIHDAFSDPTVNGILTVIGGFNSNQLLRYLDWDLIQKNPKFFCGFSDITALSNSIFAKTGLVTYSGPHYSTFGQKKHFEYTLEYFKKTAMSNEQVSLLPSREWTDDAWYFNQEKRNLIANSGYDVIHSGQAAGRIVGANLCTFNLLQGTEFMPSLDGTILIIEDDLDSNKFLFDRDLQSLIHQPSFEGVRGILIGRFQKESKMTDDLLHHIIASKKELVHLPIVANLDFGHTDPKLTLPIGGHLTMNVDKNNIEINIDHH